MPLLLLKFLPWLGPLGSFLSTHRKIFAIALLCLAIFAGGYKVSSAIHDTEIAELRQLHADSLRDALLAQQVETAVRQGIARRQEEELLARINDIGQRNQALRKEIENAELVTTTIVRMPCDLDGSPVAVPRIDFDAFGRLFNDTAANAPTRTDQD